MIDFAKEDYHLSADINDGLQHFRKKFKLPLVNASPAIYLTGNSLGAMPISTAAYLQQELNDWGNLGVEGHVHAQKPWLYYHHNCKKGLAHLCGAIDTEVVAMNSLTVNLHLLMLSFYQPTSQKFKIIMEKGAFPSDQYCIETQVLFHGYDPATAIIEVAPSVGHSISMEDIVNACEGQEECIALFLFSGVQYYTGQLFDIKNITALAHKMGAVAGFDLAHAIGNVPLQLHDAAVDFAVWCSYKYLNSGPGAVGGAFVHERHCNNLQLKRLGGWWGNDEKTRFLMRKGFVPVASVDAWQHSNAPVLSIAALCSSLDIFLEATIEQLRAKSILLTGYFRYLLSKNNNENFEIITPSSQAECGSQLSLLYQKNGKATHDALLKQGVLSDWREHNHSGEGEGVIRLAPTALYNTFAEVRQAATIIIK